MGGTSTSGIGSRLAAAAAALLLVASSHGGPAAEIPATIDAEAWYRTPLAADAGGDALCALVLCPAVPANPYPEDTLHVGVTAGETDSITIIAITTDPAAVLGGTLVLPLADAQAGTANADAASLQACLVRAPVDDVQAGAPEQVPPIDCSMSAPAEVVLGDATDLDATDMVRVDLTPLVVGWTAERPLGVALVPDGAGIDGGTSITWHLAFSGRHRDHPDARPITVTLAVAPSGNEDTSTTTAPPTGSSAEQGSSAPAPPASAPPRPSAPSGTAATPPTDTTAPPPTVAPPDAAPPEPVAAPTIVDLPYPWSVVWFLPLALLVGLTGLGTAMRRDVVVTDGRG